MALSIPLPFTPRSALVVAYRQLLSWRTNWRTWLLMRLVEPTVFFYGIGLGFAHFIPTLNGVSYLSFLLPGSLCLAAMFAGLFEGTYNAYNRAYMQRTWFSFLATPTRLSDILAGELGWCTARTLISSVLLLVVGVALGAQLSFWGTLLALPFLGLTVLSVAALGYVCMSFARSMNDFDYIWAFLATPMMVFSGVMVSTSHFPPVIQVVSQFLPLTHALLIVRPLMLGTATFGAVAWHAFLLIALTAGCLWLAHRRLAKAILA